MKPKMIFAQPSITGNSGNVSVILAGGKIDQITQNSKKVHLAPEILLSLASDALALLRQSKRDLVFENVLALCISEHLKDVAAATEKTTKPEPPKKLEPKSSLKLASAETPEAPALKNISSPVQKRRFALVFTWSKEFSHLNLLTSITLIESKKHSGRDRLKLPKELDQTLNRCYRDSKLPRKISKALVEIVTRINAEENPKVLLSEKERMSNSVQKAQDYLEDFLTEIAPKPSSPLSPSSSSSSSSSSSLFSRSSQSSAASEKHVSFTP